MKKIIKRAISAVLVAASVLPTISCSENKDVKTATIWMNVGSSKAFWADKFKEFNETKGKELGVKVVFEAKTDSSYTQALEVAIQSDQLPDFFSYGSLEELTELDRIAALDGLPNMEEYLAPYKDFMTETVHKLNGKIYSIPQGMTTRGLIYNKDMFKEAGLVDENGEAKPPKTLAEFRDYAKILTDAGNNKYGVVFPVKWQSWVGSDILALAQSSSGRPVCDPVTGEYEYTILEPIVETIMGMKEDGSVYPGAEGLDNDHARARFAEGGIGMKLSYSFDVGVLNTQFPAKCDWGVAPLPVENANNSYKQVATVGNSMQISKHGVENLGAETAAEIFKWIYSYENTREIYKQGLEIPCVWDMVSDVELGEDAPKGWLDFCELAEISATAPLEMPMSIEGKEKISEVVLNRIWTGEKNILEALKEQNAIANEGVKLYKENHPDIDYSIYIDKDWNAKVKKN